MAMKVSYSWLIYSCLIFGSSILCDRKLEKGQAVISVSEDNDDMFYCSNGLEIQWSSVCDGYKDCSDGLDETKELCARYEYGTNISMDCGKVSNESKKEHLLEETPWIVDIYAIHNKSNIPKHLGLGSIISPNVVVTAAYVLWEYGIRYTQYSIGIPLQTDNENKHNFINVKQIYHFYEPSYTHVDNENVAVIVLANKISFSNGVTPICMDWHSKYKVQNGAYGKIAGFKRQSHPANHTVLQRLFPHINIISCITPHILKSFEYCYEFQLEKRVVDEFSYQSLSFLHSNSYFLTGVVSYWHISNNHKDLGFREIKQYIPWIRGILNKHSTANVCVLPTVEGVVHSYEGSNSILSPGTLINLNTTVIENCIVGYHKAHQNGFRVCQRYGIWKTDYDKLCLKMCPPLLSESLDIKCSYYGKYSNCSNRSIPDTIAISKCKPAHALPNGQKETTIEFHCQSNGTWNNELYICEPSRACVLPTVEGVVYSYVDSNERLSHGTLINHGVIVNENCTFGFHNSYPDSFRVCQKNGKWKPAINKLCLKMCPPLISDSLDIKCRYNGKYANCSNLSIPDTIATPKCKPAHTLPNGQKETPIQLHCQSNGMWNNELYICEPGCGTPFVKTKILIINGETANVGTAPWNVAIYKNKTDYEFRCSGSIISRNLVVSAAHCFWKRGMPYNITIDDGLYKIAAGKYYKNFTIYDNENAQIINVKRIHLSESYFGQPGYYADDIAVVVLQDSVSFINGILPICIDWENNYKVSNGDQGEVVGWGKTENDVESPILLKTSLPYINMTTCRNMCKDNGFESFVTHDKFCAGSPLKARNIVDGGDSGAGLCFLHSKLYYLTGVVSLKESAANNSIALFTSVRQHIFWIRELYTYYKKVHYN